MIMHGMALPQCSAHGTYPERNHAAPTSFATALLMMHEYLIVSGSCPSKSSCKEPSNEIIGDVIITEAQNNIHLER